MPISSLATYIRDNRHLPEMPSEATIEEQGGFDVGQMNQALLKRSEENTLYIIKLVSELQTMREELELLKAAMAESLKQN